MCSFHLNRALLDGTPINNIKKYCCFDFACANVTNVSFIIDAMLNDLGIRWPNGAADGIVHQIDYFHLQILHCMQNIFESGSSIG